MRQQIYSIASLDRKTRKKMTNSSLWSIKIENGQVFIYLGKEKLKMHQVYRRVLSVKKSLFKGKDALLVSTSLLTWPIYSVLSTIVKSKQSDSRFICFRSSNSNLAQMELTQSVIWNWNVSTHMLVMAPLEKYRKPVTRTLCASSIKKSHG